MCGVLKYCGLVACTLNICVYAPLILGASVSVDSAPGLQAMLCKIYRIRQSLFYLYDVSFQYYQYCDEFKSIWPV